jgi:hypothetical protein
LQGSDRDGNIYRILRRSRKEKEANMEKYEMVRDIGSGNFGVAKLMRNKETKELVAMKYIERGHRVIEFSSSLVEFSNFC